MALTKKQLTNRKKWVDALRSGKFKQGKGNLKADNKFCCQGVACELFKDDVSGKWTAPDSYLNFYPKETKVKFFSIGGDEDNWIYSDDEMWPDQVKDLLGIDPDDAAQLVAMNDGVFWKPSVPMTSIYTITEPATFQEIADVIELLTLAGL